jgi:hypothetical protein
MVAGMEHELITSADEYARQAEEHGWDADLKWSTTVPVDPSIWHEVLDRYPDLDNVVVDHEALPDDVVERLARWPWAFIRWQLCLRDHLPHNVVELLLRDIEPSVRSNMAFWRGITLEQLIELHAGSPRAPIFGVGRCLKERFAVHWRDVATQDAPVRLAPYQDVSDIRSLLANLGFSDLEPSNPKANDDWMAAICCSEEVGNWVAYSGRTSISVLTDLAAIGCSHCRVAVAKSPSTPPQVLAALSLDSALLVRDAVAKNAHADFPTLLLLASDDQPLIREYAREGLEQRFGVVPDPQQVVPNPPPESWQPIQTVNEFLGLWNSADPWARARLRFETLRPRVQASKRLRSQYPWTLARNPTVADDVVLEVSLDLVSTQRAEYGWEIGHINDLTLLGRPHLASVLARHPELSLRLVAARSPNTPPDLLDRLSTNPLKRIADSAQETLRVLSGWKILNSDLTGRFESADDILSTIRNEDPWERRDYSLLNAPQRMWREVLERAPELAKWVAINETVGPRLLDELADWPDAEVRRWVCDHPRVWLKTLDRLAFEADPSVRRRAVYNSRLSDAQLRRMRRDSDPEVASEATRRLAAREYANRLLNDPEWWRHLGNSEIG